MNNCGHIVNSPRIYQRLARYKKANNTIENAVSALHRWYFNCKEDLPKLRFNDRDLRSESRESIASVMSFLINHLDFRDMRAKYFTAGNWSNIRVDEIAKQTGLSFSRVCRAIAKLKKAGYLECAQKRETREDGTIRANISIKKITAIAFWHLGVDKDKLASVISWTKRNAKLVSKKDKYSEIKNESDCNNNKKALAQLIGKVFTQNGAGKTTRQTVPATEDMPRRDFIHVTPTKPTVASKRQDIHNSLTDKFKSVNSPASALAMLKKFKAKQ